MDRDNLRSAVKSLNRATAMVKQGVSLIVFPEGTRATVPGAAALQERGVHHGHQSRAAHRPHEHQRHPLHSAPGHLRMQPGPIKVVISPPIAPGAFRRREELMAAVHQAIDAHYDPDFPYGPGNPERS